MHESLTRIANADESAVTRELEKQWRLVRNDDETRETLQELGIDVRSLDEFAQFPFAVEPAGKGNRADVATAILIGIGVQVGSELAHRALRALWEKVIRVEIEKRFGTLDKPDAPSD